MHLFLRGTHPRKMIALLRERTEAWEGHIHDERQALERVTRQPSADPEARCIQMRLAALTRQHIARMEQEVQTNHAILAELETGTSIFQVGQSKLCT